VSGLVADRPRLAMVRVWVFGP